MGIKHYSIFGLQYMSIGWCSIYTGTGYNKGKGFDLHAKKISVGIPRRPPFFRPILELVTDVRLDI